MHLKTLLTALFAAATITGTAQAAEPGLYIASTNVILHAELDGTGLTPLAGTQTTAGIAVDGDDVYYTRTAYPGAIGRVGSDGSGLTPNLVTGLARPFQLAVSGGKLYWTDYGNGTIGRANLDGSGGEILITGLSSPTGLVVADGHIFWSTGVMGDTHVSRANLDGSGVDSTWLGASSHVGPLTTDGSKLYWVDGGGLSSADFDGTDLASDFGPGLGSGMSLAIGGGYAFSSAMGIGRIGLDGTGLNSAFMLTGSFVSGLAAVTPPAVAPVPGTVEPAPGKTSKLEIRNTGGSPLHVTAATLGGADAADFSVALGTCASPVAVGDRCELEVTFAPRGATVGARLAHVDVTFGDGVAPLRVAVAGTVASSQVPPVDTTTPTTPTTPTTCRSVRTLAFHLRKLSRGARYTRIDVLFGGRRVKRISRPARVFSIDLAGQPKGTATVEITVKNARGRATTRTRAFLTCTPGR